MKIKYKVMSTAALTALFASATIGVPVAVVNAETPAVETMNSVYFEIDNNVYKILIDDYAEYLAYGNVELAKLIGSNPLKSVEVNGITFELDDFAEYKAYGGKLENIPVKNYDSFNNVTIKEDGSLDISQETIFKVMSIAAINETSVTVSFPSDSGIEESDLTGKTIDFKAGDQTLTAEFTSFNEDAKTAVFSLPEGSQFDRGTEYMVSGKNFTFTNDKYIYTNENADAAEIVETLIAGLPADRDLLDEGQTVLTAQEAYNELTEEAKELVSKDSKNKLESTVKNFKLFTQGEANGVVTAVNSATTLDAKRALVNKAESNLEIAKALGMTDAEFTHFNSFVQAANTIVAGLESVQVAVEAAETAIAELPAEITLADEAAVDAAREAVTAALAKDSSVTIEGLSTLEAAEAKIAELKQMTLEEAIEEAVSQISLIGDPTKLTLKDEAKVEAAEKKVEAAKLAGATDEDIVNLDHLQAARAQIETLKEKLTDKNKAIQAAKVALTNLPIASNITLADEADVEAASKAYDKAIELGAKAEDFLNVWKLEDAVKKIADLKADKSAATTVVDAITALPAVDELEIADEAAVEAARTAYDALTEAQQAFVTNLDALKAAEVKVADLKDAVQKLEEATEATEAIEALVADADKAVDLVTSSEARKAVQAAFVAATNKIQLLAAGEAKDELTARLDEASNVSIAASFVNALQAATVDLTEDTLMNANIKLTGAQSNVSGLKNDDIKAALQGLIDVEKEKITDLEDSIKLATAVQKADDAIAALPSVEDVTLADEDAVNAALELLQAAIDAGANPYTDIADYSKAINLDTKINELKATKEAVDVAKAELSPVVTAANNVLGEAVVGDAVGEYPQTAYDAFETAIADAQTVMDSATATVGEVNAAKEALQTAQATFEEAVNVSAMTAAIKAAEAAIAELPKADEIASIEDVTPELEAAINAAKDLVGEAFDLEANQSDIEGYADLITLDNKVNGLKNPTTPPSDVNKTALEILVSSTGNILQNPDKYTVATYTAVLDANDAANNVLGNTEATQAEVDEAKTTLQDAIDNLNYSAEQTVKNTNELETALGQSDVTTITFAPGFVANGNVVIESTTLMVLNLAGTIIGDLTVDTPNATVNNSAAVSGTVNIGSADDVQTFARGEAPDSGTVTWNQNVSSDNIVVNKPVTLTVGGDVKVKDLTLNKPTTLNVADTASFENAVKVNADSTIVSKKAVKAEVAQSFTATVKTEEQGAETTVVGTGTVVQVVPYIAAGAVVVNESNTENIKFKAGKFVVSGDDVTEFTFTDKDAEVTATFADNKWSFKTDGTTLEPTKEDQAAATEVSNAITSLPTDNDPLENGVEISAAKTAYEALTDAQQALVSDVDVKTLNAAVTEFIGLAKAPASGAVDAVAKEADLTKKQEIVDAAQTTLDLAKGLGMETADYNQFNGFIAEAQKLVDTANAEAAQAAVDNIASTITSTINVDAETLALPLPTVEAGYTIALATSENEAIITTDGEIIHPKEETNVTVTFTVTKDGTDYTATTGDVTVTVAQSADQAAATKATEAIKAIPTNNNPLENGEKISAAKTTYETLTDAQQALVSDEDVKTLNAAVAEFIGLAKSPANGAVTAVTNEADLAKKQGIVNAAQTTLNLARDLGMEEAEYNHFNGFIAEAQKLVDTAEATEKLEAAVAAIPIDTENYTTASFTAVTKAKELAEETTEEKNIKAVAINSAVEALVAQGEGTTKLQLADGKSMGNLIFKVSGIKEGKSEKKFTLAELATAYSAASEADLEAIAEIQVDGGLESTIKVQAKALAKVVFNTDGIIVTDGVLSIPEKLTGIFSVDDFAIAKTTDTPFHISVYDKDNAGGPASENRLAKITITKDGVTFTGVNTAAIN